MEIDPPHRLVAYDGFTDAEGNPVPPSAYGFPADDKAESNVGISSEPHPGGTLLTLRHDVQDEESAAGWNEMVAKLEVLLAAAA